VVWKIKPQKDPEALLETPKHVAGWCADFRRNGEPWNKELNVLFRKIQP
jgi:hypothetical protein